MRGPPAVPDGVLLQSVAVNEEGEPAGYRIFCDGRYETLPRGGEWIEAETLDAERLAAVERAIDAAGVEGFAERYEGIPGHGEPNVLWMQVARGGSVRTISVVGERRVPELERLTAALTDAFRN